MRCYGVAAVLTSIALMPGLAAAKDSAGHAPAASPKPNMSANGGNAQQSQMKSAVSGQTSGKRMHKPIKFIKQ